MVAAIDDVLAAGAARPHYPWGPAVAIVLVLVLALVSRWVMTPSKDQRRRREARGDFGLLVPVATVRHRDEAERLRAVLDDGGIRCTVAERPPGPVRVTAGGRVLPEPAGVHVLVFGEDVARARTLIGTNGYR